jgi:hypothetical protein
MAKPSQTKTFGTAKALTSDRGECYHPVCGCDRRFVRRVLGNGRVLGVCSYAHGSLSRKMRFARLPGRQKPHIMTMSFHDHFVLEIKRKRKAWS